MDALLSLNVTRQKDAEHPDGFVELLGKGNAELEGQSFFAHADEVTYDESKGLYTMRAEGNRKATIWRQTEAGGEQIAHGRDSESNSSRRKSKSKSTDRPAAAADRFNSVQCRNASDRRQPAGFRECRRRRKCFYQPVHTGRSPVLRRIVHPQIVLPVAFRNGNDLCAVRDARLHSRRRSG